jgi:Rab GDP dissociation inhibitor
LETKSYYGSECASITPLPMLYRLFGKNKAPEEKDFGNFKDYNVDLIPKFLMGGGNLVRMLIQTGVTRYLQFKNVDGSFVYKGGKLYKVPVTGEEALKSSLMGIFEKRRFAKFLSWIQNWEEDDKKTWNNLDPEKTTMEEVFSHWKLDKNTQDFIGHAVALHTDDSYLYRKGYSDFIQRVKLYSNSLALYKTSPYIYPL